MSLQHPAEATCPARQGLLQCAAILAQETVACFAELLEMGADMDGSPANERLTRQVQRFTAVRPVIHGALQRYIGTGDNAVQASQCWGDSRTPCDEP